MQISSIESYLATPLGIAILFAILWCASCYLISFSSGWFALSRRFKKRSEPYGEIHNAGPFFYTVYMRFWCHFTCLISLTAASDALYASILFPFRIGHPPLRIPWDEIRFGRTQYFFRNYIVLTLGDQEKIPLRISLRMAGNLGILDRCPQ